LSFENDVPFAIMEWDCNAEKNRFDQGNQCGFFVGKCADCRHRRKTYHKKRRILNYHTKKNLEIDIVGICRLQALLCIYGMYSSKWGKSLDIV